MGTIRSLVTGTEIILFGEHTVGRQKSLSKTLLNGPGVSRNHAIFWWDGESWYLKDTSTNGTYLNGTRIASNINNRLNLLDQISFGGKEMELWQFVKDDPPRTMLIPVTPGLQSIVVEKAAMLPSADNPELIIYLDDQSRWVCESESGVGYLVSGELVGTNTSTWEFVDCQPSVKTKTLDQGNILNPQDICFVFNVSQNEEHVSLSIKHSRGEIDLEERSHHYLLLILARKRLEDQKLNIGVDEQGWIDKDLLVGMLGMSEHHINVQTYRFRKQVTSTESEMAKLQKAIERRSGELRFGFANVKINGGCSTSQKRG